METAGNIYGMEVAQLKALVTRYPWFSHAREVLLYKLVAMEPQCLESLYKENIAFFPRRNEVILKCRNIVHGTDTAGQDVVNIVQATGADDSFEIDFDLIQKEAETFALENGSGNEELVVELDAAEENYDELQSHEELHQHITQKETPTQKIVVVGGDYFSKEDFAQLGEEERVADLRLGAPAADAGKVAEMEEDTQWESEDSLEFVTETLAQIYASQGYYNKAIEVYAKLILLYPEKSAYFATLVNEIKSKN